MKESPNTKRELVKVNGFFKELVTVFDEKGNIIQKALQPLMIELRIRDIVQIIVGSTLLAVPVALTEEVWNLATTLPQSHLIGLHITSLAFIALFVYYNFYRNHLQSNFFEFAKRVIAIYGLSFLVVASLLTLFDKAPWNTDLVLAIKRCIIVAFPASMSAAVTDMIK